MPVYNVQDFGAVADYDPVAKTGTDNLPFFRAALAAMRAAGNNSAILVADGHFYLGGTLELAQTVLLQGTGMNEPTTGGARSAPGTWLVFPPDVTGIRIYSSDTHDHPSGGADRTRLRDVTIWCRERGVTGHGVHATVVFAAENVNVQNFAVDGFHVTGHLADDLDGNADGTFLSTCVVGGCGRDGFHFEGGDADVSLIQRCSSVVNGRYGFFDRTIMNTYVGCHAEGNLGSEYHTEGAEPHEAGFNSTTFVGCYAEQNPNRSVLEGLPNVIGGNLGDTAIDPDSTCFAMVAGTATRRPFEYVNTRGAVQTSVTLGSQNGPSMDALIWYTYDRAAGGTASPQANDLSSLTFLGPGDPWWTVLNGGPYRQVLRLPTVQARTRHPAPWLTSGMFLGRFDLPPNIHFTAASQPPDSQASGAPQTYERGDVVWTTDPVPGGPLGQVCLEPGTQTTLTGISTSADAPPGATSLLLAPIILPYGGPPDPGQYLTINASLHQITDVHVDDGAHSGSIGISPALAEAVSAGTQIQFRHATFAMFGAVENAGTSTAYDTDQALTPADRTVTATADGITFTLPPAPLDGQAHAIKAQAGGVTVHGGAATIDGAPAVALGPSEHGTFRYSAAVAQWERR